MPTIVNLALASLAFAIGASTLIGWMLSNALAERRSRRRRSVRARCWIVIPSEWKLR